MSKKVGIGYSFREKSLEKENEELKAKIKKLEEANKKGRKQDDKKEEANKKAEQELIKNGICRL